VREFKTGATRDNDDNKLDYEGFLSPPVFVVYAEYMHMHRKQADGKLRDSDNWQKGIPIEAYMKSKWRHFMATWSIYRGSMPGPDGAEREQFREQLIESLCAEMFNTMGMLHEVLKCKGK